MTEKLVGKIYPELNSPFSKNTFVNQLGHIHRKASFKPFWLKKMQSLETGIRILRQTDFTMQLHVNVE
jgi:hypothetical protein